MSAAGPDPVVDVAPVVVDDPADPRLRDYVGLTDVELRSRREPAEGLFLAEGEKVIRRAVAAGYPMRSMLLSDKWLPAMTDVAARCGAPVYLASTGLLEQVTGYPVHRGALASMGRRPLPDVGALLAGSRRVAVLEDVNDHTNVGAIFRGAAALGVDAVLLTPRTADPLYRRSVKVSMGAVFSVPWARFERWPRDRELLREAGLRVLALTPAEDAVPLDRLAPADVDRCALVLGAEGPGLRPATLRDADLRVRIPMAAGVDSLNVAAAAAVAFYAVGTAAGQR
ncbi:MAG: TrmH family RNA methyltransferase [Motilibacteraceae bacterium]